MRFYNPLSFKTSLSYLALVVHAVIQVTKANLITLLECWRLKVINLTGNAKLFDVDQMNLLWQKLSDYFQAILSTLREGVVVCVHGRRSDWSYHTLITTAVLGSVIWTGWISYCCRRMVGARLQLQCSAGDGRDDQHSEQAVWSP